MKRGIFLFLLILASSFFAKAQNDQLKAFYTYNFIRHIGWPEGMMKGNFVICVVNGPQIAQHLKDQINGRKFGFQDFEIKEYARLEDVGKCQVLILGSDINQKHIQSPLMDKLTTSGTLVITNYDGGTPSSSIINFVTKENALYFELYSKNANRAGLKFSSRLEAMSNAIKL
jgi:hypothetical protein